MKTEEQQRQIDHEVFRSPIIQVVKNSVYYNDYKNLIKEYLFLDKNCKLQWIKYPSGKAKNRKVPGSISHKKYIKIKLGKKKFYYHHIVWFLYYGNWPNMNDIDHIDRDPSNNFIDNLRLVSRSKNGFNKGLERSNTSGYTGIYIRKDTKKWQAVIKVNNKKISLGCHKTLEEALDVRLKAEIKYYGEYKNGNIRTAA